MQRSKLEAQLCRNCRVKNRLVRSSSAAEKPHRTERALPPSLIRSLPSIGVIDGISAANIFSVGIDFCLIDLTIFVCIRSIEMK